MGKLVSYRKFVKEGGRNDSLSRLTRDLENNVVRNGISKNSRHGSQHRQNTHAEIWQRRQITHIALLELILGQRQKRRLALAHLLGRVHHGNTAGDTEELQATPGSARKPVVRAGSDVTDHDPRGVALGAGAHGRNNGEVVVIAVLEQLNLGVDVVNGIDDEVRLLPVLLPRTEQFGSDRAVKLLQAQVEPHPWCDGDQPALQALHLGHANVGERGDGVPVERAERHLVEVDQAQLGDAGAGERGGGVRADTAAADDDDEGVAQLGEPFVAEEDAVAG